MYRHTNGLLAESKIQTVYKRNTSKKAYYIKVYGGIATLAFARELSAKARKKCKSDATDTPGTEHTLSHVCGVRVSAVPSELVETVRKYTDLTPKLLTSNFQYSF